MILTERFWSLSRVASAVLLSGFAHTIQQYGSIKDGYKFFLKNKLKLRNV